MLDPCGPVFSTWAHSKALLNLRVNYCLSGSAVANNQAMLDAHELAKRLRRAMDDHEPPITGAVLSEACDVTPQAVSGWRKNGRLHKKHLPKIATITSKPLEYFLSSSLIPDNKSNGHGHAKKSEPWANESIYDERDFLKVFRAWQDTDKNGRGALLGVANAITRAHAVRRKQST